MVPSMLCRQLLSAAAKWLKKVKWYSSIAAFLLALVTLCSRPAHLRKPKWRSLYHNALTLSWSANADRMQRKNNTVYIIYMGRLLLGSIYEKVSSTLPPATN